MKRKISIIVLSVLATACAVGSGYLIAKNIIDFEAPTFDNSKRQKECELKVEKTSGGSVNCDGGKYKYDEKIDLVATPHDGYLFVGWVNEKNEYISSSSEYSFNITTKTYLLAKFGYKPDDIKGEVSKSDLLVDCSNYFEFVISCNKPNAVEWINNNLLIVDNDFFGTEYLNNPEYLSEITAPFNVSYISDNNYKITPKDKDGYKAGVTYVASLKKDEGCDILSNAVNDSDSKNENLTFGIVGQEVNNVVAKNEVINLYKDDIVELVDDGLTEGDEGDQIDYVVLNKRKDIYANAIICIMPNVLAGCENQITDETIYGKCSSISSEGTNFIVYYSTPELNEIFDEFEVYEKGTADLEQAVDAISDDIKEQIKHDFMCSESLQTVVAAADKVVQDQFQSNTKYKALQLNKIHFLDMISIDINAKYKNDVFTIEANATLDIPIYKNGTTNQVCKIQVILTIVKSVKIEFGCNFKLKKAWFIPIGIESYDFYKSVETEEKTSLGVYVSTPDFHDDNNYDLFDNPGSFADFLLSEMQKIVKKPFLLNASDIQQLFKNNGYEVDKTRKEYPLFTVKLYFAVFSINLDLNIYLEFKFTGSIRYGTESKTITKTGIKSSSKGPSPYSIKSANSFSQDLILIGELNFETGITAKAYLSIVGLSKLMQVGIGVDVGIYLDVAGYISYFQGYFGGEIGLGLKFSFYVYAKLFSLNVRYDFAEEKLPILNEGNKTNIMNWTYFDDIMDGNYTLSLIDKETDLFSLPILEVIKYEVGFGLSKTNLDYNVFKKYFDISFEKGEYLTFKDGKIIVKDEAPIYFEDEIIIVCTYENRFGPSGEESLSMNLPRMRIKVCYGNEDLYYESIDSKIQHEFRELYRSYNASNENLLKDIFNTLLDNLIADEVKSFDYFKVFASIYLDNLLNLLGTLKSSEQNNRDNENLFVSTEADIFSDTINFINNISNGEKFDENAIVETLLKIENSTALYASLLQLKNNDEFNALLDDASVDKEICDAFNNVINLYQQRSNTDKAKEIIDLLNFVCSKLSK